MGKRTPTAEMPSRKAGERGCEVPDCNRPHAKGGYCDLHYQRKRKTGSVTLKVRTFPNQGRTCADRSCQREAKKRGYCDSHYTLAVRSGQLSTCRVTPQCKIDGCTGRRVGGGLCTKHWTRLKKHGDPNYERPLNASLLCAVESCGGRVKGAGLCNKHWLRQRRNGDPESVRRETEAGAPLRWLREHQDFTGPDCLTWPFSKFSSGYGQINGPDANGAHRQMCFLVHGPPPSEEHEAAHSCGKGDEACVHPQHLSWKLPIENVADQIAHNTRLLGEARHNAKLSNEAVLIIYADPRRQCEIARAHGISARHVQKIKSGQSWSWLTGRS